MHVYDLYAHMKYQMIIFLLYFDEVRHDAFEARLRALCVLFFYFALV